jgi:hypothetical protein
MAKIYLRFVATKTGFRCTIPRTPEGESRRGHPAKQEESTVTIWSASIARRLFLPLASLVLAAAVVFLAHDALNAQERGAARPQGTQDRNGNGDDAMPADIARLKNLVPPNSHPMVDVAFNAASLWFAGEKKNWPLANYFLGETRNRMNWEVKLNPGPKSPTGEIVDMKGTVDGINNGSIADIKKAIDAKDVTAFEVAYRHLLEDCYSCHKNTNRPYLRPMIPTTPPQTIINFDPSATWPQ